MNVLLDVRKPMPAYDKNVGQVWHNYNGKYTAQSLDENTVEFSTLELAVKYLLELDQ